ncbi:MAG: nucleoside-diphosphate kinase [Thaumarchaeota archaeon]|jgi:nucleoside-diphosphate kinase|nr:nucleoside-diphosphate kinase [Candidatus Geocrenenecus arthurdayi]MCL7388356.1 nucleoside-diphosphate kinase [Candidatus Geocrenenecus arthurdayi]MCL7390446.1 nucleoside-diphosphate kinase [Candidatus Geocrenenecus arthurdayi]MCL7396099.1 nucleoside-diphosphate kinase [Candidatus Geocrenenecus arthurdayi]MCL7401496.1 nucleoside-diphosphate kinase [Candidatus Geocrenenecus arthurdayi]
MSEAERTFIMLKPSCVERGLVGEILSRIEKKGLKIIQMKFLKMSREMAEELYSIHKGRDFYENLVKTLEGRRVVAIVIEGRKAIEVARKMIGATDPAQAEPGTIRGDLAIELTDNLIHASDSIESYQREYKIFFKDDELQTL